MPHPAIDSILHDEELSADIVELAASRGGLAKARAFNIAAKTIERALDPKDKEITFDDRPMTEAIVLEVGRPVLLVRNDSFVPPESGVWRQRLTASQSRIESIIPSVGRIEVSNHPAFDWAGTGWMIADDVVVTNRHVAMEFARRQGRQFIFLKSFLGEMSARVDFKEEHDATGVHEVEISEIVFIEEPTNTAPDIAMLRLKNTGGQLPAPIELQTGKPGPFVAAIGYPARDSRNEDTVMDRIFGDIFNVKRLSPGEVKECAPSVHYFTHDCTTLGGNSGSVVFDLATGKAVGLHFAGRYRRANYAVKAATVEQYLKKLKVTVSVPSVVTPSPVAPGDEELPLSSYTDRKGYDDKFLGAKFRLKLPRMTKALGKRLAPTVQTARPGVLDYMHFSVVLHRERKLCIYAVVNIDGMQLRRIPGSFSWLIDPRADKAYQTDNALYVDNDIDRGHQVRRLDPVWGTEEEARKANRDTFHYANACPQVNRFNSGIWLRLEDYLLDSAGAENLRLTVFTGPVFKKTDKPYRDLPIPREFWKVAAMVAETDGKPQFVAAAFRLSQADRLAPFEAFLLGEGRTEQVPIVQIERETGLRFPEIRAFDTLGDAETAAPRVIRQLTDIVLPPKAESRRRTARG
jgi:endonuclease G